MAQRTLLCVDVDLGGRRVGLGPRLGALARLVDLCLDLGAEPLLDLVGQHAKGAQLVGEERQRVLCLEPRDLLRIAIAALVVVRRVAGQAHDAGLDQRGALAGTCSLMGIPRGRIAAQDVSTLHGHAGESVSRGPSRDREAGDLLVQRDADRVAVVLADEDHRQLVDAGEVHGLVDLALVGGALSEVGDGHHVVAAHPGAHRDAHRVQHLGADRRADAHDVVPRAAVVSRHLPPGGADVIALGQVGGDDVLRAHPEGHGRRDGSVEGRHPVLVAAHGPGHADLGALVALAGDDEGDLAGPLHQPHPLVDRTGEQHLAVHGQHLLIREPKLMVSWFGGDVGVGHA